MTVADEVPSSSPRQMHVDAFQLATQALDSDDIHDREFQTYIFTMSKAKMPELKKEIKRLVWDLIGKYETELDADTVTQMHFHLFEAIESKNRSRK